MRRLPCSPFQVGSFSGAPNGWLSLGPTQLPFGDFRKSIFGWLHWVLRWNHESEIWLALSWTPLKKRSFEDGALRFLRCSPGKNRILKLKREKSARQLQNQPSPPQSEIRGDVIGNHLKRPKRCGSWNGWPQVQSSLQLHRKGSDKPLGLYRSRFNVQIGQAGHVHNPKWKKVGWTHGCRSWLGRRCLVQICEFGKEMGD